MVVTCSISVRASTLSRMCSISPTGSPVSGTWLMGSSTASAMVCRSTMPSSVTRAAEHPPASSSRMVKSELTPNWARRYTRLSINEGTIGWGGGGGGASFSRPPLDWNSSFRESNIARFLPFCPLCRQGAFLPKNHSGFVFQYGPKRRRICGASLYGKAFPVGRIKFSAPVHTMLERHRIPMIR